MKRKNELRAQINKTGLVNGAARAFYDNMKSMWGSGRAGLGNIGDLAGELGLPASDPEAGVIVAANKLVEPIRLYTIAFGGDATNGNIWQNRALHNTKVSSAWMSIESDHALKLLDDDTRQHWWDDLVFTTDDYGDVQAVSDKTGRGCAAMMTKQFKSIGCPTWEYVTNAIQDKTCDEFDHFAFLSTTDDGPDQAYCRMGPVSFHWELLIENVLFIFQICSSNAMHSEKGPPTNMIQQQFLVSLCLGEHGWGRGPGLLGVLFLCGCPSLGRSIQGSKAETITDSKKAPMALAGSPYTGNLWQRSSAMKAISYFLL